MRDGNENHYWKKPKAGPPLVFVTPDDLWDECIEYICWVEEHPLKEQKVFCHQGFVTEVEVNKMRPMTIGGLCLYLGVDYTTWTKYAKMPGYDIVCETVNSIIYEQKFSGAAAGFFSAQIMVGHLGIVEKSKIEHTGKDGGPIETAELSPKEKAARINALLRTAKQREKDKLESKSS